MSELQLRYPHSADGVSYGYGIYYTSDYHFHICRIKDGWIMRPTSICQGADPEMYEAFYGIGLNTALFRTRGELLEVLEVLVNEY